MPTSPARLAANRANAQRSTGPRTAEGKARSAQNSLQHGAYAADATLQSLPDSPYAATLARYSAVFAPATPLEILYVERAAALDARLQLVRAALDALLALNERRALSDCLHEQYNRDRPAAQVQGQPSWSAALRRYDGNPDTYPSDPDPGLDPALPACTLAYTLTSPRGLALLGHETALDRRLHATLTALDRRLHATLTALDRLQRQPRETKPTTHPISGAPVAPDPLAPPPAPATAATDPDRHAAPIGAARSLDVENEATAAYPALPTQPTTTRAASRRGHPIAPGDPDPTNDGSAPASATTIEAITPVPSADSPRGLGGTSRMQGGNPGRQPLSCMEVLPGRLETPCSLSVSVPPW